MARILIVEDELIIAEDLKSRLRRLGHIVTGHATSGEAAVQKTAETKPDVILMDVRLRGEMTGIQAAERIRELYAVRVVYVTAHATAVAEHENEQQLVLMKPFSTPELQRVIATACGEDAAAIP